jgi:hypothetical protein
MNLSRGLNDIVDSISLRSLIIFQIDIILAIAELAVPYYFSRLHKLFKLTVLIEYGLTGRTKYWITSGKFS